MIICKIFAAVCLTTWLSAFGYIDAKPQLFGSLKNVQSITEICLGCICESISTCDPSLKCVGDICGIFAITWAYWADSGKPVINGDNPNDNQAYARCANDPTCARQSVMNYLTKFTQDCNGDGVIDCLDYASIHKLGGYGCSSPLNEEYKNKYNTCQQSVSTLSGSSGSGSGSSNSNIIFPGKNVLPPDAPK